MAVTWACAAENFLGLKWEHVDLDDETLQVVQTLHRVDGRRQL